MNKKHTIKKIQDTMQVFASSLDGSNVVLSITNTPSGVAYETHNKESYYHIKHIEIPAADFTKKKNRLMAEQVVVHESLHHLFTDFSVYRGLYEGSYRNKNFIMALANCIEDPFIEYMGQEKWKGVKGILDKGKLLAKENGLLKVYDEKLTSDKLICLYVIYWLYVHRCNSPLDDLLKDIIEPVKNLLGKSFAEFDLLVKKGLTVNSSNEILDLSVEISRFISSLDDDDLDDQQSDDDSNGGDSGGDQQSDDDSNGGDSGGDQQSDDDSNGGDSGGDQKSNDDKTSKKVNSKDLMKSIRNSDGESENLIQKMIEELMRSNEETDSVDLPSCLTESTPTEIFDSSIQQDLKSEMQQLHNKFLRPLARKMQSKNWVKMTYTNRGGDVEGSRLFRTLTDGKCLKKEVVSKAPNTAVITLVDKSASMAENVYINGVGNRSYLYIAELSMLSLCKALKRLNIKNAAFGFGYSTGLSVTTLSKYKSFNDSVETALNSTGIRPIGSTPTGEALMSAISKMKSRNEKRKIVYVLTDGDPDSSSALKAADELAIAFNIEVYYITIKLKWRHNFAQDRVLEVMDVAELAKKIQKLSVKTI